MPYQKPAVLTERTGLPGTPLGNTNFFIPTVIAKTLGKTTAVSRTASTSGDTENIYINGQMVEEGDTLNYDRVTYDSGTYLTTAIPRLPVVSVFSVSTDHNNPNKREFVEGLDFSINKTTGIMDFADAPVLALPEIDSTEEGTGGSITADTYDIAVIVRDANDNTTTADTTSFVVTGGSASITVKWGKVKNASSYLVYAKPDSAGSSEWALQETISSGTTVSTTLTSAISSGSVTLPTTNTTKHTPADSDYVYVTYTYSVYTYDSPKRFFDTESLQSDHGIGSELSNAGRLVMGPSGVGNGAGSMYAVAPRTSTGEINGYQNAIEACESIQELILMSTASASDTVNDTLVSHCEDMSEPENAKERFCFVSTTSDVMADSDVSTLTDKLSALNGSNRCVYVVTDGGKPHMDSWQNTLDKYNSISSTTETTPYTTNQAVDGPWHAIATMGMVANLSDPAVPATNKRVYGISSGEAGSTALWNDTRKDTLAANGGLVLEDRFNNLFVRHGLTLSQASVEDSELSIVMAEAYMAKSLRDNNSKYVGKKLTDTLLSGVFKTSKGTLDGLVRDQMIRRYNEPNVYQDTDLPTWVYVTFTYYPIYPTNVIKFEWGFDISG
jgi:hypothetical protein